MFDNNKNINIISITPVLTEENNTDTKYLQNSIISKQILTNRNEKKEDIRLKYVLTMLDLPSLIQFFKDSEITFIDFLFLTKEDLKVFGLKIYQKNRILNFSRDFKEFAKKYDIDEIKYFFNKNHQFIFNFNNEDCRPKNREPSSHNYESTAQGNANFSSRTNSTNLSSRIHNNINSNIKKNVLNKRKDSNSLRRKYRSSYDTYKKFLLINKEVNDYMQKVKPAPKRLNKYIFNEKTVKILKNQNNSKNPQSKSKELELMLNNINDLEKITFRAKSLSNLKKMKNYIDRKGNNINLNEINRINNDINKIKELNSRKEKLKQQLKVFDEAIIKKKTMISHLKSNSKTKINNIKKEIIDVQVSDEKLDSDN